MNGLYPTHYQFTSRVGPNVGLTAALDTSMSIFPNLSKVCKDTCKNAVVSRVNARGRALP
jgi:hypothetical protein